MVELFAFEIGQFEVAPVVQSWSFSSGTGRQTPPVRSSLRLGDLLGGADNPLRVVDAFMASFFLMFFIDLASLRDTWVDPGDTACRCFVLV